VFSLIAIVPDREFKKPILIVSPSVFTHELLAPADSEPTLLPPQPARASADAKIRELRARIRER
jgi:hypothetical protein